MEPPQLQVTEAYYRTRASAAGEEGGQADIPWAVGTVPTAARGQPAGISPSGARWPECSEMFSQNSTGQKTWAKQGREGRKESALKSIWGDCLGNGTRSHLEFQQAVRSPSSRLPAPGHYRKFAKEPPGMTRL